MSLLNKIELLSNKERVFIFCDNEKIPKLFVTKIISIKSNKRFIVFESLKENIKIGVKIVRRDITYPAFNKKYSCKVIGDIISEKTEDEFNSLLMKKKLKKQKQIEKTFTIKKSAIPDIKITSGNYKINLIKTTLKQQLKSYIKKLIEIDKTYQSFVKLLSNEKSFYSTRDAHIFIDMLPDKKKLIEIQQIINQEYQPILGNLLKNNFNLTNISPIVLDKKKLFTRDANDEITLKKTNEHITNTFLMKNLLTLHDESVDEYDIGDIPLELNIIKNYFSIPHSIYKYYKSISLIMAYLVQL